jgi:O-antigen/teichoic acid export membrane protein
MKRLGAYKVDFLLVAGFVVLPLLLFAQVTIGGRTMLPADNLFQWAPWATAASDYGVAIPHNSLISDLIIENYAWKRFILNSVHSREAPLWNPYLFAGAPFLATGQHGAYYPFSLLFLIIPLAKAYGWYTVSQLWLAGVLMYVFGRTLGQGRASAALAGLVYQGCGFMVVSAAVFPMIIGAAAWLPLLLACIEKVIDDEHRSVALLWLVLGALALGMQILAGHIEITYYSLLIMAVYAAWRLVGAAYEAVRIKVRATGEGEQVRPIAWYRAFLRPSAWLLGMVLLGLMLGAIQLIPFYEVGQANFRQGSATLAEVRGFAFPVRRIIALALPNFFGNPTHHSYVDALSGAVVPFRLNYYGQLNPHGPNSSDWGIKNYVEGAIYVGVLPLFLAALGAYAWLRPAPNSRRPPFGDRSLVGFFVILSLFSVAFIFGTPLYALLYYGLPFINQLHTPFRWVFPLSLSIAALAGYGADYLAVTREPGHETWRQWLRPRSFFRKKETTLDASRRLGSKPSLIPLLAGLALGSGVLLLGGLFASRALYGSLEPAIERVFLGLAQAPDAFPHARAFYSYQFRQLFLFGVMLIAAGAVLCVSHWPLFIGRQRMDRRPIWPALAAAVIILDLFVAGYGFHSAVAPTLLAYKPALAQWLGQQPGLWRLTTFTPSGDKPFHANAGWLFDFQDVRGYDSIIAKQYTQYMAAIEPQRELAHNRIQPIANWESLNSPLLDVLGVRYIISAEVVDLPKLQLVWTGEGLHIYENLAVAPRAYTLPRSSTVVAEDALAALTAFDPRQYVVVERRDWPSSSAPPMATSQSPAPRAYVPANVDRYGNIEVRVTAEVADPAWLVLNDSYFPGWKAYVRPFAGAETEEKEVNITRVNGNFRGVMLEPGHWTVRYRYSPLSFKLGGLASFMSGIILLFAVAVWSWRRYSPPEGELTKTRSIAKNSIAPMLLNLFNKLIDFGYAAFYLRLLGPADAGSYTSAIVTAGIFEIVANYGLNILLIREVAQDKSQAGRYLLNTTILRLGMAVAGSLPIAIFILGTHLGGNALSIHEVMAIGLIMVGMVFSGMAQGVTGLFYVYEKAEVPAAMTTVTTIFKVGLGVMVLLLGFGFVGLAAVSIVANVITLAILAILAGRTLPLNGPWQVDWRLQRRMVQLGYPLMLIHLLQTIFISIDIVLLRQINGEAVVGWYSSAYKWFNALQIVPSFFTLALFPVISREIQKSLDSARRMYQMSLKLMLLLALPTAALTTFMAYPLVQVVGGAEFLPAGAIALQIIIWSIPIGWLNSVTNYVLIALGLEKMQPRAFVLAVCFNIMANLIFLPRYSYVAASVITILSEGVLLLVFNYYLRQRLPGMDWPGFLWRPFLATALMVLAMWLGAQINLLASLVLGLVAYPLGLWLLRVFGEEERHILRSILPPRKIAVSP